MLGKRRDEDKVNRYIRQRIRAARNEREMSQQELATHLQKSRVAVSDLERGRVQVNAADLAFIANALDKPISYFYPPPIRGAEEEGLSADEQQLIHWFRRIWH
jgi:transcriptional regulator with XRE-family HTH domain